LDELPRELLRRELRLEREAELDLAADDPREAFDERDERRLSLSESLSESSLPKSSSSSSSALLERRREELDDESRSPMPAAKLTRGSDVVSSTAARSTAIEQASFRSPANSMFSPVRRPSIEVQR
jgi:hypothetical protein